MLKKLLLILFSLGVLQASAANKGSFTVEISKKDQSLFSEQLELDWLERGEYVCGYDTPEDRRLGILELKKRVKGIKTGKIKFEEKTQEETPNVKPKKVVRKPKKRPSKRKREVEGVVAINISTSLGFKSVADINRYVCEHWKKGKKATNSCPFYGQIYRTGRFAGRRCCHYNGRRPIELVDHIAYHHSGLSDYICKKCGFVASRRDILSGHVKSCN